MRPSPRTCSDRAGLGACTQPLRPLRTSKMLPVAGSSVWFSHSWASVRKPISPGTAIPYSSPARPSLTRPQHHTLLNERACVDTHRQPHPQIRMPMLASPSPTSPHGRCATPKYWITHLRGHANRSHISLHAHHPQGYGCYHAVRHYASCNSTHAPALARP